MSRTSLQRLVSLDRGILDLESGRIAVRVGETGDGRGINPQVDAPLVERNDLVRGDDAGASCCANHESVEDVLLSSSNDVIDGSDRGSVGCVDGHAVVHGQER